MKNTKRRILSLVLCLFMMSTVFSLAHSGRTDGNGGHKDNKNASGLGSYHYHCGGNPAHLHPNGVCPYDNATPAKTTKPTTQSPTSNAKTNTVVVNPNNKSVYIPNYTIKINDKAITNQYAKFGKESLAKKKFEKVYAADQEYKNIEEIINAINSGENLNVSFI